MGASQVEAVVDVKYASRKLHEYDYVVVKEVYDKAQSNIDGVNCVNFGWVKDCLIMGRLLPNPKA